MKSAMIFFVMAGALLAAEEKHIITVWGKEIPFSFDHRRQVWVIEGEALQSLPASSLPALIGMLGNIHLLTRGLFQTDAQQQGLNQEQFLVMINGIPCNNAQTGHHNFSLPFSPESIERLEILRGSWSSMSIFSGAAGAVNIVPKKATSFSLRGGGFHTAEASAQLEAGPIYCNLGMQSSDGFQPGLDGKKYFLQGGTRFTSGRSFLDIWSGWTYIDFGAANFYAPYPSRERLNRWLGMGKWRLPLGARQLLSLDLSSQWSGDDYYLIQDKPQVYANFHRTWQHQLTAAWEGETGRGSFRTGIDFTFDRIDSTGIRKGNSAPALGEHHRRFYSLFGESRQKIGPIYVSGGIRCTSADRLRFSGNILLETSLGKHWRWESSWFQTFRVPTYTELYYEDPMHLSNPGLRPEQTRGIHGGLVHSLPKRETGIHLFYHHSKDLIDWVGDGQHQQWTAKNLQRGDFIGIDVHHSFSLPNFSLVLFYSYQHVDLSLSPLTKPLKYHYYFPDHTLSLQVGGEAAGLSVHSSFKCEHDPRNRRLLPFWHLRTGKRWKEFFIYIDWMNIFNTRLERIPAIPDPPRSLQVGLQFNAGTPHRRS